MVVNENLTVFNLVDGIVDEFHDESGTDEAEISNDAYCAAVTSIEMGTFLRVSRFFYNCNCRTRIHQRQVQMVIGSGTMNTYTTINNMTSAEIKVWGGRLQQITVVNKLVVLLNTLVVTEGKL